MNKIKQILALTGSALIITSFHHLTNKSDIVLNNSALLQTDTVPKKTDSMPTDEIDTTGKSDTASMAMKDTSSRRYVDLKTGQLVELYYDAKTRRTYSAMTNEPIDFYVDMITRDTVYGRGRYVVNNYIQRSNDGMYRLDAGKIKMDKDDLKIKDGSNKIKMDNSNMKIKAHNEKMKADTTGTKMKGQDMKRKIDSGGSKSKNE